MKPPKTAGNTLFGRINGLNEVSKFRQGKIEYFKELDQEIWVGHISLGQFLRFDDSYTRKHYRKVCFVRNPYDRVYSAFVEQKQLYIPKYHPNDPLNRILNNSTFNGFVETQLNADCIRNDVRYCHYRPLDEYTHHQGSNWMSFIGYTERFEQDFDRLCDMFNIHDNRTEDNQNVRTPPLLPSDPHRMKWKHYKYLDRYESKTIARVNSLYANDFERFGYQMLSPSGFPEHLEDETSFSH